MFFWGGGIKISSIIIDEANLVILGAWNTAIVNPKWIAREILGLPEGTQIHVDLSVGSSTNTRSLIEDLFFYPSNDQIIINPARNEDRLFQLINKVGQDIYSKLPYTPVIAIGHNFTYQLESDEDFPIDIDFAGTSFKSVYKDVGGTPTPVAILQHSLSIDGDQFVVLNISMVRNDANKTLRLNYHYQTDNNDDIINFALERFCHNYTHSKMLVSTLLEKEVKQ